jgi:hypothetical protein
MIADDERRKYAAQQYVSLREEMNQARGAQHSILQWNQAVAATLFAAAIVAGEAHSGRFVVAAQFILCIVVPAVLLGGALAWAGEMIRMERAGVFLRSFERATWNNEGDDGLVRTSFFVWENLLWFPPANFKATGYRKQNVAYAGVAIFYGTMYLGSLIAFCILSAWPLALAACMVLITLGIVVMVPSAVRLFTLGRSAPRLTGRDLSQWITELDAHESAVDQGGTLMRIYGNVVGLRRGTR